MVAYVVAYVVAYLCAYVCTVLHEIIKKYLIALNNLKIAIAKQRKT